MLLAFLSPQPVFMHRRYGRHDAGAINRMQPFAWRTGHCAPGNAGDLNQRDFCDEIASLDWQ